MNNSFLAKEPQYYRSDVSRGGAPRVDRTGGNNKAGLIRGVSVITRGEARGHDAWIDSVMLGQVHDAIAESDHGIKSRFTHPDLSGDGLGTYTGRFRDARIVGDQVVADLHFGESSHDTPDGDLAKYLMDLAEDDPESFGTSIVFSRDIGAEESFVAVNLDDRGEFVSPDADNARNFQHRRLAQLRAVDAVDEPAANPNGLFHRPNGTLAEAQSLASYALGMSESIPVTSFGVDPSRVRGFVARYLDSHGLYVAKKEDIAMGTAPAGKAAEKPDTELSGKGEEKPSVADQLAAKMGESEPVGTAEAGEKPSVADQLAAKMGESEPVGTAEADVPAQLSTNATEKPAKTGQDYLDAFGTQGGVWFAEGKSWQAANAAYLESLRAENASLREKLAAVAPTGEVKPVGFDAGDQDQAGGGLTGFFAGKLGKN